MALSATLVGSASSTTSGTSLVVTTTATIPANSTVLVAIAADNSGSGGTSNLVTPAVPAGLATQNPGVNTPWTTFTRSPGGAANDGAVVGMWVYNSGPTAIASGATFTYSFGTTTSKAAQVWYLSSSISGSFANKEASTGNTGSSTSPTVTASVTINRLAIGFLAHESNSGAPTADTDTTNGTWSSATQTTANTGTSNTSMILYSQYKVATATGNQTWNQTSFTSSDYANFLATFQELAIPTGTGAPALAAATASASGSATTTASASGAVTLANATASASGAVTVTGTGASTLADATADASGAVTVTSTGASTLADATAAASGSAIASGTATSTLSDATGTAYGSVVFSPSQLAPVLWLDASDTATITQSANAVSSWLDKSTNARTFTQTTASAKPTTNTRTVNGKNVIDFDGNDLLIGSGVVADWKFLHDGTKYLIAIALVQDGTSSAAIMGTGTSTSSFSLQRGTVSGGVPNLSHYVGGTLSTGRVNNLTTDLVAPFDRLTVFGVLGDPAQTTPVDRASIYVDGYVRPERWSSRTGALNTANPSFTLRLGGLSTTGSFNGAIAEIVVLTGTAATEANWNTLVGYLQVKWGGATVIHEYDTSGIVNDYLNYYPPEITVTGVEGTPTVATPGVITLDGVTGSTTISAVLSGSPTLGDATTSASGVVTVTGTVATALSSATGTATGSVTATAVGASNLVNATGSAVGSVTANGTASPSLANATGSASVVVTAIGTAAPSLANATAVIAGNSTIQISGSSTLANATAAIAGVAGNPTFGSSTLANATGAAVGAVTVIGTASPSLGAASASAAGVSPVQASGASTLTNATAAAVGSPIVAGAVAATLGAATSTASGTATATATEGATLGDAVAAAIGSPIANASGSSTLGNATCIGLQSFSQTKTTGIGTIPLTGLAGISNAGVMTIIGATATYGSRGLITFSGVAGRPQYGAITLTGSHVAPAGGPIDATPSIATFVIEGNSNTPTEGTLAQTATLVMVGAGNPPTITKHLTYWDGTQWRIARFKEWNGSGWAESDRVKSHAGTFTEWEKVY